jgi:hypothetical protein
MNDNDSDNAVMHALLISFNRDLTDGGWQA